MGIKYPPTRLTRRARHEWLCRFDRLLQKEHNIMGDWFEPDEPMITFEIYQTLRAGVQQGWPWTGEKLSKAAWERYLNDRYIPKDKQVQTAIGQFKFLMKADSSIGPNLDDGVTIDG